MQTLCTKMSFECIAVSPQFECDREEVSSLSSACPGKWATSEKQHATFLVALPPFKHSSYRKGKLSCSHRDWGKAVSGSATYPLADLRTGSYLNVQNQRKWHKHNPSSMTVLWVYG